jgi:hypothetical protein
MRSSSADGLTTAAQEYFVLRQTIAVRGTVRVVIVPAALAAWSGLAIAQLAFTPLPLAALASLAVLASGFEAVNALHVGVERIGRYLQVFYEETSADNSASARWETTAMAPPVGSGQGGGRTLPGGGIDPLFTLLFAATLLLNFAIALVPSPTVAETGVVGLFHLIALGRIARARIAAGKQRARDLEHYRHVRDSRL